MKIRKHKPSLSEERLREDCWNLDVSFCKWMIPRLKYLKENNQGYPSKLSIYDTFDADNAKKFISENDLGKYYSPDMVEPGYAAWIKIQETIIEGFTKYIEDDHLSSGEEFDEAMRLFHLFIQSLWI